MLSFIAFNPCKLYLYFNASTEEWADSLHSALFALQQMQQSRRGKSKLLARVVPGNQVDLDASPYSKAQLTLT